MFHFFVVSCPSPHFVIPCCLSLFYLSSDSFLWSSHLYFIGDSIDPWGVWQSRSFHHKTGASSNPCLSLGFYCLALAAVHTSLFRRPFGSVQDARALGIAVPSSLLSRRGRSFRLTGTTQPWASPAHHQDLGLYKEVCGMWQRASEAVTHWLSLLLGTTLQSGFCLYSS